MENSVDTMGNRTREAVPQSTAPQHAPGIKNELSYIHCYGIAFQAYTGTLSYLVLRIAIFMPGSVL